jgi:ABC-type nitrate/sulfonate/bicarbonate transport system substrate-binding protein
MARFTRLVAAAGGLAVVVAAAACASSPATSAPPGHTTSASAAATITIGLPTSVTSFANADVAVAQARGFFKAENLTVNVQNLSSGVPVVQGVVGGHLDIGASSIEPVVNADVHGAGVVIIGSYTDRLTVDLVTPKTITSPAQLRGKRLGIQQVGAFREVMTRIVLEQAGMTQSDVAYIPGSSSGYTSSLLQGTIQSAVLQQEQVISALHKDSKLHVLVNYDKAFPDYFYGTYVVSKTWLAGHEDVAQRFLTAIVRAHRFMYQNKAATVPIVAQATGFSQSIISKAYDTLLGSEGVFPVNAGLDPARISSTLATMTQYKIVTGTAPSESSLVDTTPIDAVVRQLGTWTGDPRWH